jgi:hypothetical protein
LITKIKVKCGKYSPLKFANLYTGVLRRSDNDFDYARKASAIAILSLSKITRKRAWIFECGHSEFYEN